MTQEELTDQLNASIRKNFIDRIQEIENQQEELRKREENNKPKERVHNKFLESDIVDQFISYLKSVEDCRVFSMTL